MKEIKNEVFIQTSEELVEEQKSWDDQDPSKHIDFSVYPYWITTDNGETPLGIHDLQDLIESI